jgi:hypothetical protein
MRVWPRLTYEVVASMDHAARSPKSTPSVPAPQRLKGPHITGPDRMRKAKPPRPAHLVGFPEESWSYSSSSSASARQNSHVRSSPPAPVVPVPPARSPFVMRCA